MKPSSYREMQSPARLENGAVPGYALGVGVRVDQGRLRVTHSGGVMGFVAFNVVYPEERAAITVLTNQNTGGASQISDRTATSLFTTMDAASREFRRARPQSLRRAATRRD